MAETSPPITKFHIPPFSVCLWEKPRDEGEGTRKFVSVEKSNFNRETKEWESDRIWLQLKEVSCLASLLQKMEEAVVDGTPF